MRFTCLWFSVASLCFVTALNGEQYKSAGEVASPPPDPDVIVYGLYGTVSYGSEIIPQTGELVSGFAVGTIACNAGTANLVWFADTNQHPVIAQNMYRLMDNRFEQIGMSWVKHGFYATDSSHCAQCTDTNGSVPGYYLAVGCSDLYSASLNGNWTYLGPRSEINAHTGYNPGPVIYTPPPSPHISEGRLQVPNADLDPALNPGAVYYLEGHYVTPDDAEAGNDDNNIAYKQVIVLPSGVDRFMLAESGEPSVPETAAIYAWAAVDPTVVMREVRVPDEGLFIVGAKSSDLGDGFYRYEYAVFNMNSDRSAGSFSVPLPPGTVVDSTGFHDVSYHSGEIYSDLEWNVTVTTEAVTWSTLPADEDWDANALRWSTLYNFRLVCTALPGLRDVTLGLFKPGTPTAVTVSTEAPAVALPCTNDEDCEDYDYCTGSGYCSMGTCHYTFLSDCNGSGREDECDIAEGTALDCNTNGVPDECDIASGFSFDENGNGIPDECCDRIEPMLAEADPVRKNRYISMQPPLLEIDYAIRVRVLSADGFPSFDNAERWVGPPAEMPDEYLDDPGATFTAVRLICEPYFRDWSTVTEIHVYGGDIVPGSIYHMQTLRELCADDIDNAANYSEPLEVTTLPWGDIVEPWFDNVEGVPQPDFKDISSVVAKFQALPTSVTKARAQLRPNCVLPWRQIDFKDIAAGVSAFVGDAYWYHGPCACPSEVLCGATACTADKQCGDGFCIDGFCTDVCGRCLP